MIIKMKERKTKSEYRIGPFALAMALVGNIVGVSFSTGREAMTFFVDFGPVSLLGMGLSYLSIFTFGYMAFATARNMNKYTFDWVMAPRGLRPIRILLLILTLIILISSLSAMYAGTGVLLQSIFGVPFIAGALFMVVASLLTVAFSMQRFTNTLSIMVPVMLVLALVICAICAIWPSQAGSGWHSVSSDNPMLKTWWASALVYFGMQTGAVVQMIVPMSSKISGKKAAILGNAIAGGTVYALAMVLAIAIVRNYSIASVAEIPIVELALSKASVLGILYCVVAILAIYSTTAAFLLIVKSSLASMKALGSSPKKLTGALTLYSLLALAVSFIGFSNIVDRMFVINGTIAFFGIIGLAINFFYYRKHPQSKTTAVDNVELASDVSEEE